MIEICQKSIQVGDFTTLKELLLRFSYLLQLRQYTSEEQFTVLLQKIQFENVAKREPFELEPEIVYLFLEGGVVCRRDLPPKSSKSLRTTKQKTWMTTTSRACPRLNVAKDQATYRIDQFDSYEEQQSGGNKNSQNVYYCLSGKATIVLFIELEEIPAELREKIRKIDQEKVRFLWEVMGLKGSEKGTVAKRMHKFQYGQIHFGQLLFGKGIKAENVFFLKSGSLRLFSDQKKVKGTIVGERSMIGFSRGEDDSARCVSSRAECYFIKLEDLLTYFPKVSQLAGKRVNMEDILNNEASSQILTDSSTIKEGPSSLFLLASKDKNSTFVGKGEQQKRKCLHRSMDGLRQQGNRCAKLLAVKKHFSSYYSDMFAEFSERRKKQLDANVYNQQNLKLYQLKVISRKSPGMQEVHSRLKRRKIQKMEKCLEDLQKRSRLRELRGVGVALMDGVQ